MSMQNSVPNMENEIRPDFCATAIKVENKLDDNAGLFMDAIKGETSNFVGDSFKTVADHCGKTIESVNYPLVNILSPLYDPMCCKQFEFLQTDRSVKTEGEEAEKDLVTSELVGRTVVNDQLKAAAENLDKLMKENASASVDLPTDGEQLHFSQTDVCLKVEEVEEGEEQVKSKMEGCTVAVFPFKTGANDCAEMVAETITTRQEIVSVSFASVTDLEQFDRPQTDSFIKTEEVEGGEGSLTSEFVSCAVADDSFETAVDDDEKMSKVNGKNLQGNVARNSCRDLEQFSQTDVCIKMEEVEVEEGLITSELVGRLPEGLEDFKDDNKSLLNAVQCEVSSKNKPQVDVYQDLSKRCTKTSQRFSITQEDDRLFKCLCCEAEFVEKSNLLEHLPKYSDGKAYSCSQCPAKLEQNGNLTDHPTTLSSDKHFECAHCTARFRSKRLLTRHISRHFDDVASSCPCCPSESHQAHHSPLCNQESLYTCAHCPAKFKTKRLLASHMTTHIGKKSYSCPHCPVAFKRRYELKVHMKRHLKEKFYLCHQCPAKFPLLAGLKAHLRLVHTDEKPFSCTQCPVRFSLKSKLKEHLIVHSDERKYTCVQCLAKFKCSFTLKRHLNVHSQPDKRPFRCPHCSWRFKSDGNLNRHIRTLHSDLEKRYACNQCSYRTYNSNDLTKHLVVHNGEKPFACDKCPAKFTRLESLKRHAPLHSNERPFGCELCSKTFKSKRCLQYHLKVHSSENRYACPECPFTFPTVRSLKAHSILHSSETVFGCTQCPAVFSRSPSLKLHLAVHSGKKPFECAHCACRFRLKYLLKTHIHRLHKDFGSPQVSSST